MAIRVRARRGDLCALALLCAAIGCYYFPWLSLRQAFFQVDIGFRHHPIRAHAFEMLRSGHIPFWTSHVLGGYPLLADGQAAILYPLSWVYLVLPPEAALTALIVLHLLLMGATLYLFLRSRAVVPDGALFGALTLVFSSYVTIEHVLPNLLSVLAWLPLLLWFGDRALATGRWRHFLGASASIALMHLAGEALATLLACTLYAAFVLLGGSCADQVARLRRWATALVPLVVGTALAAPQLLCTLEFLGESTRGSGAVVPAGSFIPREMLLTLFSPNFFGDSFAHYSAPGGPGWEESLLLFLGWPLLLLVPFGLRRQRGVLFWFVAPAAALFLCIDTLTPLTSVIWSVPPFCLFRWPTRVLLWYSLGLSIVAAHGYDALVNEHRAGDAPHRLRFALVAVSGALFLALLGLCRFSYIGQPLAPSATSPMELLGARGSDMLWLALNWLALLTAALLWRFRRIPRWGLVAVLYASLWSGVIAAQRPEGVRPDVYQREPAAARFLKRTYGPDVRIYAATDWDYPAVPVDTESMRQRAAHLAPDLNLRFGLRGIGQFDLEATTTLRRSKALLLAPQRPVLNLLAVDAVVLPETLQPFLDYQTLRYGPAARQIAAVVDRDYHLCSSDGPRVYCRNAPAARAFLVSDYKIVPDSTMAFNQGAAPDPRTLVLLEREPDWPADAPVAPQSDSVVLLRDEPTRVELAVSATHRALLVLADTYYPGWEALVDERPTEVLLADGLVRALPVSAGAHRIVFRYRARTFLLGIALSLALQMAILGTLGLRRMKSAGSANPRNP
jgi:hypothetical protein